MSPRGGLFPCYVGTYLRSPPDGPTRCSFLNLSGDLLRAVCYGTGERAQHLKALAVFSENAPSSTPRTRLEWLTTTRSSSSARSDVFLQHSWACEHMYMHIYIYTH